MKKMLTLGLVLLLFSCQNWNKDEKNGSKTEKEFFKSSWKSGEIDLNGYSIGIKFNEDRTGQITVFMNSPKANECVSTFSWEWTPSHPYSREEGYKASLEVNIYSDTKCNLDVDKTLWDKAISRVQSLSHNGGTMVITKLGKNKIGIEDIIFDETPLTSQEN